MLIVRDARCMDYKTIASIYLAAPTQTIPVPPVPDSPARRLRDALEPIATQGWWSPQAGARTAGLGLEFLDGYVWGRAASLGDVASSVVTAAFAVFEPTFLAQTYERGRAVVGRGEVLAQRELAATESLTSVLGEDRRDEAGATADVLMGALGGLDGAGRPLFSGLRQLGTPPDGFGRLWRAAELVREHRGDGHVAACVAAGLDALSMNVMTELWLGYSPGEYSLTRGFGEDALAGCLAELTARGWVEGGSLTRAGVAARLAIEHATDVTQAPLVAALGGALDRVVSSCASMSDVLLQARTFPSDPRKRAAG